MKPTPKFQNRKEISSLKLISLHIYSKLNSNKSTHIFYKTNLAGLLSWENFDRILWQKRVYFRQQLKKNIGYMFRVFPPIQCTAPALPFSGKKPMLNGWKTITLSQCWKNYKQ